MTFLQNELLIKNEIIKSLTETTILEALSSFKSNQQYEGNQTNLLTCQKQISLHRHQRDNSISRLTTVCIMNA